ncbi:MAG TPA: sigma 54-interacting transcriptional regulator, partial [Candidatus Eisenbacteria bacterium]|nr:sigma 54-interacting transcriptional regulator [Candidatus Eisenbacteria bacterium]
MPVDVVLERADSARAEGESRTLADLMPRGPGPYADTLGLAGWSRPLLDLGVRIAALAPSPATVFVHGETGTGKELIARALHEMSPRRERPFLPHNFAA